MVKYRRMLFKDVGLFIINKTIDLDGKGSNYIFVF